MGRSVSLSDDGDALAVGAMENDGSGLDAERALVFRFQDNEWLQRGQQLDRFAAGDKFGRSVILSGDGYVFAAGAYYNHAGGQDAGHVRIFRYSVTITEWEAVGLVINGMAARNWFGRESALSGDGTTLVTGCPFHEKTGSVRVFIFDFTLMCHQKHTSHYRYSRSSHGLERVFDISRRGNSLVNVLFDTTIYPHYDPLVFIFHGGRWIGLV